MPFGNEDQKAVAFNPETARFMKLGALTYAAGRLTQGNCVSIQGRVEMERRGETASRISEPAKWPKSLTFSLK